MPSAFDRLLWTINLLARNGFLVVPVSQLEQDPSLMEDRTQWAEVRCQHAGPYTRSAAFFKLVGALLW